MSEPGAPRRRPPALADGSRGSGSHCPARPVGGPSSRSDTPIRSGRTGSTASTPNSKLARLAGLAGGRVGHSHFTIGAAAWHSDAFKTITVAARTRQAAIARCPHRLCRPHSSGSRDGDQNEKGAEEQALGRQWLGIHRGISCRGKCGMRAMCLFWLVQSPEPLLALR